MIGERRNEDEPFDSCLDYVPSLRPERQRAAEKHRNIVLLQEIEAVKKNKRKDRGVLMSELKVSVWLSFKAGAGLFTCRYILHKGYFFKVKHSVTSEWRNKKNFRFCFYFKK